MKPQRNFRVLSRIKPPENSSIFPKMRVYDGESLKDAPIPKASSYQGIPWLRGVDEGMNGLSTPFRPLRFCRGYLTFDHSEIAANPVHLFYMCSSARLNKKQFPANRRTLSGVSKGFDPRYVEVYR